VTQPAAQPIVLALPKGRLAEESVGLLARAGYDISSVLGESRRLVHECGELRVLIVRSSDVPTYVDYGAADVGICGRDVLDEQGRDLYEPLDLGIGACRMMIAEPERRRVDERSQSHLRVATKYPVITRRYLQSRGITAEIIELGGSVELAVMAGLADRIVDMVQTGETLRQNGLVEVETIMQITARLVVNPARLKLRSAILSAFIERVAEAL
jgi:ATP phosphoribosyltransferase